MSEEQPEASSYSFTEEEEHEGENAGLGTDDGMFDEDAFFTAAERNNRMSMDPMLPAPYDLAAPNAVPPMGSPAASEGATPPSDGFFDTSATYVGAFEPGAASWLDGWTAFPQN